MAIFAVKMIKLNVMTTFITLAIYIVGVWMAYNQIQRWSDHEVTEKDEYQTLFMLSMFSWLIYPLYALVRIYKKCGEG